MAAKMFVIIATIAASVPLFAATPTPAAAGADADARWDFRSIVASQVAVPLVGYFNRDSYQDIFWYGPGSAPDEIWLGTSQRGVFKKRRIPVNGSSYAPVVGDFAGDKQSDIMWYCPGACADMLWVSGESAAVFRSRVVPNVRGRFYINSVQAKPGTHAVGYYSALGVSVLRDNGGGKDDVLYDSLTGDCLKCNGTYVGHFDDAGSGALRQVKVNVPPATVGGREGPWERIAVVGDFADNDKNELDDLLMYGPGNVSDTIIVAEPGDSFHLAFLNWNGPMYNPTRITRYSPPIWGMPPPARTDSVFWYDVAGCGVGSVLVVGFEIRKVAIPRPRTCQGNDFVKAFSPGSVLVHRFGSNEMDYIVYDSGRIEPLSTEGRHVGPANAIVGDFDGDRRMDILWYAPGPRPDQIWYGRVGS